MLNLLSMEVINNLINIFIHLDEHLIAVTQTYGSFTYFILFLIIFMETGLVITPFLPGDSLLFMAGSLAAGETLHVGWLFGLLVLAAIVGDTINYWIGHYVGPKVFKKEKSRFFKKKHLERTHKFYEKHGGKAIILARFVPIIRTFAPFVAGIGKMSYKHFIAYNIIGGIIWVSLFVLGGYYFGNLPFVKNNFHLVMVAIIFISVLPIIIEYINQRKKALSKLVGFAE